MRIRHLLVTTAAITVLTIPVAGTASAAEDTSRKPQPTAVITATVVPADLAVGDVLTVTANGVSLNDTITVEWGDGQTETARRGNCSPKSAAKRPAGCLTQAWHRYPTVGQYSVTVTANGTPVTTQQVTVTTHGPSTGSTIDNGPRVDVSDNGWRNEMLSSLNALRAANGAAPLTLCPALSQSAQKHANDMHARGYVSHTTPEGVTFLQRIAFEYRGSGSGENIFSGLPSVGDAMQAWTNSPAHFRGMVNPMFTHVGFGNTGVTWVQNFGAGGVC